MSKRTTIISGPIFVAGTEIRSDDIIGPAYLSFDLKDAAQRQILATYAFGDFATSTQESLVRPGDDGRSQFRILIAGNRFGRGSARRHPCVAIGEAGIMAIVARSFDESFERHCVDEGMILPLRCPAIPNELLVESSPLSGTVDLDRFELRVHERNTCLEIEDPGVIRSIWEHGGLAALWNEAPSPTR